MSAKKYVATTGGHYVDQKTGQMVRFEVGDTYEGPVSDWLIEDGVIVAASEAGDLKAELAASTDNEGGTQ